MKLLQTFDSLEEAEAASEKLIGLMRIASERDSTETIYNLFGEPTWGNFNRLDMYGLKQLKDLLVTRENWTGNDRSKHSEIVKVLEMVSKNFEIKIPLHWL